MKLIDNSLPNSNTYSKYSALLTCEYEIINIIIELCEWNETHPRKVGSMIMACSQDEDYAEELLNKIKSYIEFFKENDYIPKLGNYDSLLKWVEDNEKAIENSRKFLSGYIE